MIGIVLYFGVYLLLICVGGWLAERVTLGQNERRLWEHE